MFNFLKKKKGLHYDPTRLGVLDLRKGWILDYDLKTWKITEEYEYDWGDENFTYEFQLTSTSDDVFYLHIDNDDEIICTLAKKINFALLDNNIERKIIKKGRPPKKIEFNDVIYYRDAERPGFFRNISSETSTEFISWDYYDEDEKKVLSLEQWGARDFEVSLGLILPETAFSNILPVKNEV